MGIIPFSQEEEGGRLGWKDARPRGLREAVGGFGSKGRAESQETEICNLPRTRRRSRPSPRGNDKGSGIAGFSQIGLKQDPPGRRRKRASPSHDRSSWPTRLPS